jgi:hypothetical protein
MGTVSSASKGTALVIKKTNNVKISEIFVGLHVQHLLFLSDFNPNQNIDKFDE